MTGFSLVSMVIMDDPRLVKRPEKYSVEVYGKHKSTAIKKMPKKVDGKWSAWSSWSPCSRSCGGGIMKQTRHCIIRPADSRLVARQRRRRQHDRSSSGCIGLYKRFQLCNIQSCSTGKDFREEQCSFFDHKPFKGKTYTWQPFYKDKEECVLNCRPKGMDFYATFDKTVIDGTSCRFPQNISGQSSKKGICVEGICKGFNLYGVIDGLDDGPEECSVCSKGSCRSINGIYTRADLPPGYSLVAQIPKGACRLFIQQLKHTRNILALRSNGTFLLNGDWRVSNSRSVEHFGMKFSYTKQDNNILETITSPGPLTHPVDIMIINYQMNSGIKYGYSLPVENRDSSNAIPAPPLQQPENPSKPAIETRRLHSNGILNTTQKDEAVHHHHAHRRTRLRRKFFHWKVTGLSACTKSCGGGLQNYTVQCVREIPPNEPIPVHEKRCAHLEAPKIDPIKCNEHNCPPYWFATWGPCSASCGDGIQYSTYECQQELPNGDKKIVDSVECKQIQPTKMTRNCRTSSCEGVRDNELTQIPETVIIGPGPNSWVVGAWTPCSASCGKGYRTRSITCSSGQCPQSSRPNHAEYCETAPCITNAIQPESSNSKPTTWLSSEWSQCSESCGTGIQTRIILCLDGKCDSNDKPETFRSCSSEKECGGQWVTGPWSECSNACFGVTKQKRAVLCVVKIRGQWHMAKDVTCPMNTKPAEEQACESICSPQWFIGDWGKCENCPNGFQTRHVECLEMNGIVSKACKDDEIPQTKRRCSCDRSFKENTNLSPFDPVNRSCVDKIRKCKLAVQARLCHYPYYMNQCCESCRRAQQQDTL